MNENVKKVFEILGVEPDEEFKIKSNNDYIFDGHYKFDENLIVRYNDNRSSTIGLADLLNGNYKIIKLPKKKKLRDLTKKEYKKWYKNNCDVGECSECPFVTVNCSADSKYCWINHKDLYSNKFLNQEIEVPE